MNISNEYKNYFRNKIECENINNDSVMKTRKFSFQTKDEKIYYITESLNEINKLKEKFRNFFKNHHRIPNLEEVINNFILQKNEFINDMNSFLKMSKDINKPMREIFFQANNILKFRLDEFITQYKILKQKIYKKSKVKDNYYELKDKFLKDNFLKEKYKLDENNGIKNDNSINKETFLGNKVKKDKKLNKEDSKINSSELINYENYDKRNNLDEDNSFIEPSKAKWVQKYLPKENKSINETLNILNDLSNLMKSFSQKVYFHSEITNQSKINFISIV